MRLVLLGALLALAIAPAAAKGNGSQFSVGTVLFSAADIQRECWTQENLALLTTRMLFNNVMPSVDRIKADDDAFVADIIEYFRLLLEVIRANADGRTKHILLRAATDTMGGFMKHLIMPISKYAYYAGNIQYASIIRLYQLFDELKSYLRTNGEGWARPWKNAGRHIQAKAIAVQSPAPGTDPCKGIIYLKHVPQASLFGRKQESDSPCGMEVPLPFFDSKSHPAAIAVPFRTFGLRNLESRVSAYILVKYFVAVSKCMAARNTNDEDVHRFNANIFSFIVAKVMPHLGDEKFYAAFGGVLRILQTVTESSHAKGQVLGNINIMPETVDREPPDMQESEDLALAQGKSAKAHKSGDRSRNNLIMLAALATILIWFCLGACFVCCRIRASKLREDKALVDDENACREGTCPAMYALSSATSREGTENEAPESHTKVLYSVRQVKKEKRHRTKEPKSSPSRWSKKSSKSSKSSKPSWQSQPSLLTNTTEEVDSQSVASLHSRGPSELALEAARPPTPAPAPAPAPAHVRVAEHEREWEAEQERYHGSAADEQRERLLRLKQGKRASLQDTTEPTTESGKPPEIQVHSVQYYPPTFACHTSMTGKVRIDSSTDFTSKEELKRPYVFGYDFQTTSEDTSPRDNTNQTSEGENDMVDNHSK